MYRYAVRGESNRHRQQLNKRKNWWSLAVRFSSYARGETDRQTNRQTYSSQYFAPLLSFLLGRIASTAVNARCGLLLQMSHVCASVRWSHLFVAQKRMNRSRCSLGKIRAGSKNHVSDKLHIGATWRIRLNDPFEAATQAVATITAATCCVYFDTGWYYNYTILSAYSRLFRYHFRHADKLKLEGAQRVHISAKWRLDWVRTDTHTHRHTSENSISASFTPFTWRI